MYLIIYLFNLSCRFKFPSKLSLQNILYESFLFFSGNCPIQKILSIHLFILSKNNEEKFQQDYQANIKPNDINIIKFKDLNGYNFSFKKSCLFFVYIIIILVFLLVNVIYFMIKTLDYSKRLKDINQFNNII